MPSPGSRTRIENVARLAVFAAIAWLLWASTRPAPAGSRSASASDQTLPIALRNWTRSDRVDTADVALSGLPNDLSRRWLAALRRAGLLVTWRAADNVPVALEVERSSDPVGPLRVFVAADAQPLVLRDALGVIDTIAGGVVRSTAVSTTTGALQVAPRDGQTLASGVPHDSIVPRAVLVLGRAGWEGKFIIAALEERGWTVAARLHVAPNIDVTQRAPLPLDTAHVAAVVALDTTAARDARAILDFVRQGGGLVLVGDAGTARAFSGLAPGAVTHRVPSAALSFASNAPRQALAFWPVTSLRQGTVVLETRGPAIVAAGVRRGAGRVIHVGYEDSWRWRMSGAGDAPGAHRAYWSGVVASAAYRPAVAVASSLVTDPAPLAHTIDQLGAPTPAAVPRSIPTSVSPLAWWMFALIVVLLLGEWASRRVRGAP